MYPLLLIFLACRLCSGTPPILKPQAHKLRINIDNGVIADYPAFSPAFTSASCDVISMNESGKKHALYSTTTVASWQRVLSTPIATYTLRASADVLANSHHTSGGAACVGSRIGNKENMLSTNEFVACLYVDLYLPFVTSNP